VGRLGCLCQIGLKSFSKIEFQIYLAAELDEFKRFKRILNPYQGLNFLINKNLNFGSRIQTKQF
jgi:hypothetical protein